MMGGWKQKSGWIQIPTASCVPFTFPFLSQSHRVCAPTLPLTNIPLPSRTLDFSMLPPTSDTMHDSTFYTNTMYGMVDAMHQHIIYYI